MAEAVEPDADTALALRFRPIDEQNAPAAVRGKEEEGNRAQRGGRVVTVESTIFAQLLPRKRPGGNEEEERDESVRRAHPVEARPWKRLIVLAVSTSVNRKITAITW